MGSICSTYWWGLWIFFSIVKLKKELMKGKIKFIAFSLSLPLSLPCPPPPPPLTLERHQRVTNWLSVWLLCLAHPIVLPSVPCSPFAMLWKFHTYRPVGSIPRWTIKTCFTSTSIQIMQLSAGQSWIWFFITTGKQWPWCMKTAQVWMRLAHYTWPFPVSGKTTKVFQPALSLYMKTFSYKKLIEYSKII